MISAQCSQEIRTIQGVLRRFEARFSPALDVAMAGVSIEARAGAVSQMKRALAVYHERVSVAQGVFSDTEHHNLIKDNVQPVLRAAEYAQK